MKTPVVLWNCNISFAEKNMKRIKPENSTVTLGLFIYNISMVTISPSCNGLMPILPCLPISRSLSSIWLGFLPDILTLPLCRQASYTSSQSMLMIHSTGAPYSPGLRYSKDLDLHATSAIHLHGHTLDFVFTWNWYSSESLNMSLFLCNFLFSSFLMALEAADAMGK